MSAADHLNQLEFPGMPPRVPVTAAPEQATADPDAEYRGDAAHDRSRWGKDEALDARNPIRDNQSWNKLMANTDRAVEEGRVRTQTTEEFIPPWRTTSMQGRVNMEAVEHQVQHADPLNLHDDVEVNAYDDQGVEHYQVMEGNHRTLAAQRRGQLLMPARVDRLVEPPERRHG